MVTKNGGSGNDSYGEMRQGKKDERIYDYFGK